MAKKMKKIQVNSYNKPIKWSLILLIHERSMYQLNYQNIA